MILGKALKDRGETVRRAWRLEGFPTRVAAIIEQGSRQCFSLLGRRRHLTAVSMTFQTLAVSRSRHGAASVVFLMAGGARTFVNNIGLVKRMFLMARGATLIDALVRKFELRADE